MGVGFGVAGQPGQHHDVVSFPLCRTVRAQQPLPAQPGPGGDPQRRPVVRRDLGLDPVQTEGPQGVHGDQPDRAGGVPLPTVCLLDAPGEFAHRTTEVAELDVADLALVGDDGEVVRIGRRGGAQGHQAVGERSGGLARIGRGC